MPPRKAAPTCQRTAHFCVNSVRMFLRFTLRGSSASTVNSSNIIILFSIISLSKDCHYYYYHHHHHNNIGKYDLKKTEHLRMHTFPCQIISQAVELLNSLLPRVNEDVKSNFFVKPCYTPEGVFFGVHSYDNNSERIIEPTPRAKNSDFLSKLSEHNDRSVALGPGSWKVMVGPSNPYSYQPGGISGDRFYQVQTRLTGPCIQTLFSVCTRCIRPMLTHSWQYETTTATSPPDVI